jgi:V/A-type H+/Na+-transporting ATPase subunit D
VKLNVNPNRMELLRLRRRLALAQRGHKLLKDKLEEIMRRFLENMRRLTELHEKAQSGFETILISFAVARSRNAMEELDALIPKGVLELTAEKTRILSLAVPRLETAVLEVSDYDLPDTDAEFDVGVKKTREVLPILLEIAGLWKAVELLAKEIELTRRRVNALEHILIPGLRTTIRHIASRLEEMERSYQVQLMRVKDIVREH